MDKICPADSLTYSRCLMYQHYYYKQNSCFDSLKIGQKSSDLVRKSKLKIKLHL